ncbi:N-6 DNA methylase [Psychroserpens sp. Hel_I_66]|uniref:N-6 DNA methylase n=1 Tax=Psychroserpens sp. Hel_I_66 TaxID=1250004 RepID=UPI00064810DD|nr:N-6 DNA methylase [Psychroserpens sp. Hel_I_66]
MREDNYRDNEQVILITELLWKSMNILRGVLPVEQHHVFLFLLSAYYDDIIVKEFTNVEVDYEDLFYALENDYRYRELSVIYIPLLKSIPEWPLTHLIEEFGKFEKEIPEFLFNKVFDNLLFKLASNQGKYSGEFLLPNEVSSLVMQLVDIPNRAKVFNPFAGLASFATHLSIAESYYGQEIVNSTWALGMLRLLRLEKSNNINIDFRVEDSINNWPDFNNFDLVISNPPFNYKIDSHLAHDFGQRRMTAETYILKKGLESINFDGKVVSVLSQGILYKAGEEGRLRQSLVNQGLIDTIISLPGGLLEHTSLAICIMVLTRKSNANKTIRLVDASTFVKDFGRRNKRLEVGRLLTYINLNKDKDYVRDIPINEVIDNDYNLTVERYFLEVYDGKQLNQFLIPISGSRDLGQEKGYLIRTSNLSDNELDYELNINDLEKRKLSSVTRRIATTAILLSTRWKSLKPTLFKFTGTPIFIGPEILAFEVNENYIDIHYLINELKSEYVNKQLSAYQTTGIVPFVKRIDLLKIKVQMPSLQEQQAKVSGIIEYSSRLKKLEEEKEKLLSGIRQEETESSTSFSHVLGKPLLNIGSSLDIIQNALDAMDSDWREISLSERKEFTMSDAFQSIFKNVKYIQQLADQNTSVVSVSKFELTEIRFLKFLSNFTKQEKQSLNHNIELNLDIHEDIQELMKGQVVIKGNEQKLRIVLLNLIDNANNHAFIEKEKEYKINIEILPFSENEKDALSLNYELDVRKSYVEIKVSNTGIPFPNDFTLSDYVRKNFAVGKNGNQGLGGYEVNEILKVHNQGKKALNIMTQDENQEFSSTVSFIIPVI